MNSQGPIQRWRTCAGAAFTLVELLVVVAIIALLIAMLLPSLSKARAAARTTVCLSNKRQIAVAMNGYANDWGSVVPAGGIICPSGASATAWYQFFLKDPTGGSNVQYNTADYLGSTKVVSCPDGNRSDWNAAVYGAYQGNTNANQSYDGDYMVHSSPWPSSAADGNYYGIQLNNVTRAADVMLYACTFRINDAQTTPFGSGGTIFRSTITGGGGGGHVGVWLVHQDATAGVFADAHAQTVDEAGLQRLHNAASKTSSTTGIRQWYYADGSPSD